MPGPFDASKLPTPEEQERKKTLDLTQGFATGRAPEAASEALRYARETGVPFEQAEAAVAKPGGLVGVLRRTPSWNSLVREAPVLAERLSDPGRASAMQDDVSTLQKVEDLFAHPLRGAKDIPQGVVKGAKTGFLQMELARLSNMEADGIANETDRKRISEIEAEMAANPELQFGIISGIFPWASEQAGIMWEMGKSVAEMPLKNRATQRANADPETAALLGIDKRTELRDAAGFGMDPGQMERGLAFNEFKKVPGTTPEAARGAANFIYWVNGGLEFLPMEKVLRLVPGAKALLSGKTSRGLIRKLLPAASKSATFVRAAAKLAGGMSLEGVTEFLQELMTASKGIQLGAEGTDFSEAVGRAWREQKGRLAEAGVKGAAGAAGMTLASPFAQAEFVAEMREATKAKERGLFWTALSEAGQESKTRERLPEEYRAFVDKIHEKYGDAGEVSVPKKQITALFQKEGFTEEEIREKLPGVAAQLARAGDEDEITVLLPDFAAYMAPLAGAKAIEQDLRVGDEMTLREAADSDKRVQEIIGKVKSGEWETKEAETPSGKVYSDVMSMLDFAPEEVAHHFATMWTAFAESRAARKGTDVFEEFKSFGLSITNSDLVEAMVPEEKIETLTPEQLTLREKAKAGDEAAFDALVETLQTDELTGANTQSAWKIFAKKKRPGWYVSIDANDLKRVNDTISHPAGDEFLKAVSGIVGKEARSRKGKFFRGGQGDELILHFLDRKAADEAIAGITEAMNALPPMFDIQHKVSVSLGLGQTFEQADAAQAKAKERARAKGRSGFGREGAVDKIDLSGGDVFSEVDETPAPVAEALMQKKEITEAPEFKKWFKDSKVVDEDGDPKIVYHGAKRPDRIGTQFRKTRATSGPMAFFTDDSEIASKYATGKADTSLEPPSDYAGWFKMKVGRSKVEIDRAWWHLTPEKRQEVAEKLPRVVWDNEDGQDTIRLGGPDEYGLAGKSHWDYTIQREARGNVLRAAVEIWLNSAGLYDQEERFLEVLRAAGLDDIEFDSPFAEYPAVFPVYLSIQNPLDTGAIPADVKEALAKASRRQKTPTDRGGDLWDKRAQDPQVWIERLHEDEENGTTHSWTSIPDWVTKVLKAHGYDGIKDIGGKYHDVSHTVWIPFEDGQVKSAIGNRGTFSSRSKNILYQPAYHGTPHRGITAFSLGKIGTGEGAQAYGWGLYFAEKKGVAEDYRKKLSGSMIYLDGKLPETEDDKAIVSLLKANGYGDASPLSFAAARERAVQYLKNLIAKEQNAVDAYEPFAKGADPSGAVIPERQPHYQAMVDRSKDLIAKYEARIARLKEIKHAAVADSYALPLEETVSILRERAQRRIEEIKGSEAWKAAEKYADDYEEWERLRETNGDPARIEALRDSLTKYAKATPVEKEVDNEALVKRLEVIAGQTTEKGVDATAYTPDFWALTQLISRGGETSFGEAIKNFEKDTGIHTADLVTPPAGQTYKVDLPEKSELLDWDNPWEEQPESVRKKLLDAGIVEDHGGGRLALPDGTAIGMKRSKRSDFTSGGRSIYHALVKSEGSPEAASRKLFDAGIDGLIYLDGTSRNRGKGTHNFVIWNDKAVKILDELYQRGASEKQGEDYRGKIEFDDTRKWFKITLTGSANLSTFLHESGHAFLEILRRDALAGHAQSAEDLAIVEKWMAEGGGDRTAQLERFARAFEVYLMEGKAPSSRLAEVFSTFKAWLKFIYSAVTRLKVNLTPEVREVMDRLLATDNEIANAREKLALTPALGPTELEPADLHAFNERFERAVQAKRDEMERDAMILLRRSVKDEQVKIRAQVEEESNTSAPHAKAWNATEYLRTGKRLDGSEVAPEAGKKLGKKTIREYVEEGDRRFIKLGKMIADDGMDADALAPFLGFADGQEMVTAILDAPSRAGWIKEQTDARMADKYPHSTIASLAEQAMEKLHSPEIDSVLEAELDAFDRKTGAAPAPRARDVMRLAARKRVEEMTVQEMQPGVHLRNEERASREVLAAVSKKDYATARDARRRQMWHRFMYRETMKAKEEINKIRDYLHGFEELPTRKRIGHAGERYTDAIDAIIEGIDLSKSTNTALARRASLEKYLQEMEAEGEPVAIPPELRAELGLKSWRQMSLSEIRAVKAAVENIAHLAMLKNKIFDGRERREFVITSTKLAEHVRANVGVNYVDGIGEPSWWALKEEFLRKARANMTKIEFIARVLDGGKTAGWAHELIFEPLVAAQNRKYQMTKEITEELLKPFQNMSLKDRLRFDRTVDFLGHKLKFREVIALVLNLGNESNKEKLLKGFNMSEEAVMARLNEMYAKGEILDSDLDLVQHMWNTINKLWPETRALAQRNVGVAPEKTEATPLTIGKRTLEGGYYPVVYNRRLAHKAEMIAQRKSGDFFENNFLSAGALVALGFTKERTEFFAPISLSLDVIPTHVNEVIHYLTHYEAVTAVDKLTSSKVVRDAITEGLGRETYGLFRPWLQAIAADGNVHESTKWYDAILRRLRLGSSIALLGFKVTTGLKQIFGLATSAKEIGRYTVTGARILVENVFTGKGFGEINDLSTEFANIDHQHDRDIGAMFRKLEGTFSYTGQMKDKIAHFALAWMMLNQKAVNAATWYGAREKALREGHPDPVRYANSVVRMTQSGGGIKDLAAIQRGSEMEKTMTVMYTYFSVVFNQITEGMPNKPRGQKLAILAARWWWLVTLPVLIDAMLAVGVPDDDKDKEEYLERMTLGQILYFGRSVPLAGQVAESFFGERQARYGAWIETLLRGAASTKDVLTGEATRSDVRNVADLLGATTGLPASAAKNAQAFMDEWLSGKMEEPVQNLLFRNPSEWE